MNDKSGNSIGQSTRVSVALVIAFMTAAGGFGVVYQKVNDLELNIGEMKTQISELRSAIYNKLAMKIDQNGLAETMIKDINNT